MKTLTNLQAKVTETERGFNQLRHAVNSAPAPGVAGVCQVSLGHDMIVISRGQAVVGLPISELMVMAVKAEPRLAEQPVNPTPGTNPKTN